MKTIIILILLVHSTQVLCDELSAPPAHSDVTLDNSATSAGTTLVQPTPVTTVTQSLEFDAWTPVPPKKLTLTPTPAPRVDKSSKKNGRYIPPTLTPTPKPGSLPLISVIPNPVRGAKADFRIQTQGKARVRVRIYNEFLDVVTTQDSEGYKLIDILWNLKNISEGVYSYQAQVIDEDTGAITTIPLQKFVVIKDN